MSATWEPMELRRAVIRSKENGRPGLPLLSMSAEFGVRPRDAGGRRAASEDLSNYLVVTPNDLVVNKLSARDGAFGHSLYEGLVSPAYWVLRSEPQYDPRYLSYALHSAEALAEIGRKSKFMPPAQYDISWEDFRSILIPSPPLGVQRRIADFLDDQTTRIDNIITARQKQIDSLQLLMENWAVDHYSSETPVPIRRLVREVVVGIVVKPADWYTSADDGVPALRGTDVSEFAIASEGHVRISPEGHSRHPRSVLSEGDIVVVRTGDAGSASVVPSWASGWNAIDLVIVRPAAGVVSEYLEFSINAARWGAHVGASSSGSIQQHFGVGALLELPVPANDEAEQRKIIAEFRNIRSQTLLGMDYISDSVRLLQGLKRSLISAAVSGEFDVSSADGSGVVV